MKAQKVIADIFSLTVNMFFLITVPIWWPCLLAFELMQILFFNASPDRLLGSMIDEALQRNAAQST